MAYDKSLSSSNPAFSQDMFGGYDQVYGAPRSMVTTVQGTVSKTFLLLAILSATALWSWNAAGSGQLAGAAVVGSALAGFIVAMVTIFKPTLAPWTAPIYAAMEGVFLGAVSQAVEMGLRMKYGNAYQGVALQAVSLTAGTTLIMLFLYASRIVRVTDKLRAGIMMATGALMLFYLATMLLRLFGVQMPLVWSATPLGIGFSVLVVGLAAFNLLLDFDFIDEAARREAPKYMEWYGAFGLMVTLVWLYLEILRLLSKLANSRD